MNKGNGDECLADVLAVSQMQIMDEKTTPKHDSTPYPKETNKRRFPAIIMIPKIAFKNETIKERPSRIYP